MFPYLFLLLSETVDFASSFYAMDQQWMLVWETDCCLGDSGHQIDQLLAMK